MEIKIEIISRETIKPSSPTPNNLQKHKLSFLDQIAPPIFMPLIYFYPFDNMNVSNSTKSIKLKTSLSQTLTTFYPLAGRLIDDLYVDCNDHGPPYVEAQANCEIFKVIKNPMYMHKFLPYKLDDIQNLPMAVQITFFKCGGIAVGLVISHKIADALSLITFANSWAAVARHDNDDTLQPNFEAAAIFPQRDMTGFTSATGLGNKELVTKIFTFPTSKISILRERYSGGGDTEFRRPTRVEALSTFIWTRFISAIKLKPDPNKIFIVLHAVNLRTRFEPPLSEFYFGNISRIAIAWPAVGDGGVIDGGYELLQKVREAIQAVNSDYVAQLREEEGDNDHLNFMKELAAQAGNGKLVAFNFTSLCGFPIYGADFGWGKPGWAGLGELMYKNLVTFMSTASGDGIEAWISLTKEDMEIFEGDLELQQFMII